MIVFLSLSLFISLQWVLPDTLHAEVQHEALAPQENFIPEDPAFEPIAKALKSYNYRKAIQLTEDLNRDHETPGISESAAFLMGDIYLIMAERDRPLLFRKALDAYREAHFRYPESKQTPPTLIKMGMIFLKESLYYEALATFDRIVKKFPTSPQVIPALINKGDVYLKWGKYDKAITAFDKINPAILSPTQSTFLLLNYAETYYLKKEYKTAFGYYELVSPQNPILQASKKSLYQYGISAYKSEAYTNSRELLFILHNKYPKSTYSLLALARIGDSLRLQGKIARAKKVYQQVYAATGKHHYHQSANLIAAIGELHIAGCAPMRPQSPKLLCFKGRALDSEAGRLAYEKIQDALHRLFNHQEKRPDFIDRLILETASALERHTIFTESLKIKKSLIQRDISKRLKRKIEKSLPQTAIASVNQLFEEGKKIELLNIYYSDPDYFSPKVLKGKTGLNLGVASAQSGLYQEAIHFLDPIAHQSLKEKKNQRKTAYFYLITSYYKQREYVTAERQRQIFIKKYPKSLKIPQLAYLSAKASLRQNKAKLAIKKFKRWLSDYTNTPELPLAFMGLGDAYVKNGDLDQALESYLKIKEPIRKKTPGLYLKIADTFFKLKNYKRSISFYTKTIETGEGNEALNWAKFQVAQSYEKLGIRDKGQPIYTQLGRSAQGIIRALSRQKALELSPKTETNAAP